MLRINLLPEYVAQRRLTARLLVTFIVLFLAIVIGLGGYEAFLYPQVAILKTQVAAAEANEQQINNLTSEASAATAAIAPIQADLNFVTAVKTYNTAYNDLYQTVARYTYPKSLYNSESVSGTTLTIDAYMPSIKDLGRYLELMYTEPDASAVGISAIPGYGAANPDVPTTVALPAGIVGHLHGFPGSVTSFTVFRGKIVAVDSNANGNSSSEHTAAAFPTDAGSGGVFNPKTDGFPVTVTLTLKSALVPPALPGAAAATTAPTNSPGGSAVPFVGPPPGRGPA